ncbi:Gfo/Idh/MocA family protein [Pontibacter sp. SGAir0037]|uniref:Gfo/Idh/MocA family protein n=1 Tax=Pontibacter sp. SGAir0037 TaxID=2571030 RepID=UPI0010CD4420|nr:Gfo/Idh/MocA family oxidoreductase [Pontibacter sp. SGAir0037]QCR21962.1 glucose-fructose oxidoreductase [Pontibacter sp. SGAir0037]
MNKNDFSAHHSRRRFLKGFSIVVGTSALGVPLLSLSSCQSSNSENSENTEAQGQANSQGEKLGIALVGLGGYSKGQLAPALQETKSCYLAGIVTGTPSKIEEWKSEYDIPDKNVYNYENFDEIANNPDIDIIYIVLPNGMHAEYTIRAANAGKHVICEKPMATSVEDCQRMIDACRKNNVTLSIGYRLHFEPHNIRVMELGQQQVYGKVTSIKAADSFRIGNKDVWRLDKELAGGGPLMDVGIYCVQGACYTMGKAPVAVTATFGEVTKPDFFDEVEESINWTMEFDDGTLAECTTSYNDNAGMLRGEAENGWWELDPAYSYSGIDGETSEGDMNFPHVNQQALQMDGIAESILQNKVSIVPGEMGMRDVRILMAIYEAARTGKRVAV